MDIDRNSFPHYLLSILEALSSCTFLSIDFEFSGVASKPPGRSKQALQARYDETRRAAERFQILQAGITCAEWDYEREKYVLRSWNIPIAPTFVEEGLDLEREWSMSSGAMEFLLHNGFDFNVSFEDGVPYLSRQEERVVKEKFEKRTKRDREYADIEVGEDDVDMNEFLEKVRGEIGEYLRGRSEEVEILSRTQHWRHCLEAGLGGDLTSFDKRLIHQLIHNEYPQLIAFGRRQSIAIKYLDEEREAQIRQDKYKRLKKKVYFQTGFRWIIEAITRGSLAHIDLNWFATDPETGASRYCDTGAFEARFHRAKARLRRKAPVLVGHNCFTDLIYLYAAFIGPLPESVEDFQKQIHEMFPVVLDTKYLFTHNCGNMNPMSSLDSIEEELRTQVYPRIETHKAYGKYEDDEPLHEAGYDSLLTARVMILLSAKLEAQGMYVPESVAATSIQQSPRNRPPGNVMLTDAAKKVQRDTAMVTPMAPSRFATRTLFEALADMEDVTGVPADSIVKDEHSGMTDAEFSDIRAGASGMAGSKVLDPTASPFRHSTDMGKEVRSKQVGRAREIDKQMPPFDSDFWRVYANKLRIFGTVEGMLDLDPERSE